MYNTPVNNKTPNTMSPGKHKPNEKMIGIWLDIEIVAKLERACILSGQSKAAFVAGLIIEATANVELTEEDKQTIIDHYAKQL